MPDTYTTCNYLAVKNFNALGKWVVLDREWSFHLICKRTYFLLSIFERFRHEVNLINQRFSSVFSCLPNQICNIYRLILCDGIFLNGSYIGVKWSSFWLICQRILQFSKRTQETSTISSNIFALSTHTKFNCKPIDSSQLLQISIRRAKGCQSNFL